MVFDSITQLVLFRSFSFSLGDDDGNYRAHEVHTAFFLDILDTTKNPAYLFQALSGTFNQVRTIKSAYQWTNGYLASFVLPGKFSISVEKVGLSIVTGIVATHVMTITTIAMFLDKLRKSLLGTSWQIVGPGGLGPGPWVSYPVPRR